MSSAPIRVLVVDDSAFARKVIREVLSSDPEIEVVGIARDGLDALEKIAELKPDVLTLDLVMPDLDGIALLKSMPTEGAPKVVVVTVSGSDTDLALEALHLGAVDVVTKPTPLPTDRLYELSTELISKVKAAQTARPRVFSPASPAVPLKRDFEKTATKLVVIGTSTGGPQALTQLFKDLPPDLPVAVAIALHIPSGFTMPLAERLTRLGGLALVEAHDGLELKAGQAVIAPGGMHLKIVSRNSSLFCSVSFEPTDTPHHPSVDVLFESAAKACGAGVIGIVLTGMGNDGTSGSSAIKRGGGRVLVEAESSCVVYGMPRSVADSGHADRLAPLEKISEALLELMR